MIKKKKQIVVFDLDDTLIFSEAKIKVYDSETNELVKALSPSQFNYHVQHSDHYMMFTDFDCEKLIGSAKIHKRMFDSLRSYIKRGVQVAIVTARSDKNLVLNFFKKRKVDIKPAFVYAVHDPKAGLHGSIADRKKQAVEDLIKKGYNYFTVYDDNMDNLIAMDECNSDKVKVKIIHVLNDKEE